MILVQGIEWLKTILNEILKKTQAHILETLHQKYPRDIHFLVLQRLFSYFHQYFASIVKQV